VLSPLEGAKVNPKLTMGENIGDLSGLAQAYRAYRVSLKGKEPPVIDGLTGDQRFFIGYAQAWRTNDREAALRQQLSATRTRRANIARTFRWQHRRLPACVRRQAGRQDVSAPGSRVRIW
jgi:predicted metalloendopeptidase